MFLNTSVNSLMFTSLVHTMERSDISLPSQPFQPEIQINFDWVPTTREEFRSWTGRRRISGVEFHGPVYVYGSVEDSQPYTGHRVCGCKICQTYVEPMFKSN